MKNSVYVAIMATVAAMGGLLFGFDTGVISGAIPFLQQDFGISDSKVELLTTMGLLGAVTGALVSGNITERIGRRRVILSVAVIFSAGALWAGLAPDITQLMIARFLLGIGIGTASFAVPLYIAEISPAKNRGALVSLFQLMITLGILVSYLSDLGFADEQNVRCWKPMFLVGVIPALILLIGMFFMPESPRWLLSRGRRDEAYRILLRTEGDLAAGTVDRITSDIEKDKGNSSSWKDLLSREARMPLLIAVGIMFFQQCVGINTVMYYSPKIFGMAGFDSTVAAIAASAGVGLVNLLATLVSVYFVDRLGRRKLFFLGMGGMVLSLVALAASFLSSDVLGESGRIFTVVCTFLYVIFYAISIGPLGWLIISEVFPQKLRALGSSVGSLAVWVFNCAVTFTFFKLIKLLSIPGTETVVDGQVSYNPAGVFLLYAAVALAGIVWGWFFVPETKGVPLEDIEKHWKSGGTPRSLKKSGAGE